MQAELTSCKDGKDQGQENRCVWGERALIRSCSTTLDLIPSRESGTCGSVCSRPRRGPWSPWRGPDLRP